MLSLPYQNQPQIVDVSARWAWVNSGLEQQRHCSRLSILELQCRERAADLAWAISEGASVVLVVFGIGIGAKAAYALNSSQLYVESAKVFAIAPTPATPCYQTILRPKFYDHVAIANPSIPKLTRKLRTYNLFQFCTANPTKPPSTPPTHTEVVSRPRPPACSTSVP